ncbi:SDR family NAD(P)-dependent oxidoreductase, partial [Mesorhizobium sp. Cs1299R1N1]|uniref:SDR family NAD(P)-dependent oxidoreductase n=1 Tax=Mesorhizobium sp. Cs1299R1N1 TaxID=3015172 RepID=UPI00301C1D2A
MAQAFAATKASLVLVGRDAARGQRVVEALRRMDCPAELLLGDVTERAFADQVIDKAVEMFGKVDVLVNSAG